MGIGDTRSAFFLNGDKGESGCKLWKAPPCRLSALSGSGEFGPRQPQYGSKRDKDIQHMEAPSRCLFQDHGAAVVRLAEKQSI